MENLNGTMINVITREDVDRFREEFTMVQPPYAVNVNSLDVYQKIATKSAIYPGAGTPVGLAYVALKMNGEAGEFAEHVGKAMRDDDLLPYAMMNDTDLDKMFVCTTGQLTPERRVLIIKEIGDVLWYLSAACNELGITLSEAAATNLEKLADRTERNALRGSGDER